MSMLGAGVFSREEQSVILQHAPGRLYGFGTG
jgi:hypothetical protein